MFIERNKKEGLLLNKFKAFLEKNKLHPNSFKFKIAVGRFKGFCHNNTDPKNLLEKYIEGCITRKFPSVKWIYVRDYERMYKYRKKHKICEICKKNRATQTHHKISTISSGLEKESNYIAVCWECHWLEHPYLEKKNFERFK